MLRCFSQEELRADKRDESEDDAGFVQVLAVNASTGKDAYRAVLLLGIAAVEEAIIRVAELEAVDPDQSCDALRQKESTGLTSTNATIAIDDDNPRVRPHPLGRVQNSTFDTDTVCGVTHLRKRLCTAIKGTCEHLVVRHRLRTDK